MVTSQPNASSPAEPISSFAARTPARIRACGNRAFEYASPFSNHLQSSDRLEQYEFSSRFASASEALRAARSPGNESRYSCNPSNAKAQARGLLNSTAAGTASSNIRPAAPRNPAFVDLPRTVPNPQMARP